MFTKILHLALIFIVYKNIFTLDNSTIVNPNKRDYPTQESINRRFFEVCDNNFNLKKKYLKYTTLILLENDKFFTTNNLLLLEWYDNIDVIEQSEPLDENQKEYFNIVDSLIAEKINPFKSCLISKNYQFYFKYLRTLPINYLTQIKAETIIYICKKIDKLPETQDPNEKPKITKLDMIQDSLNNKEFFKKKPSDVEALNRYVKCNLEGTTGWIPYRLFLMTQSLQRIESDEEIKANKTYNPWGNKYVLEGPSGNGKSTFLNKIAKLSDCKLIEVNTASLMKQYVNTAAGEVEKYFNDAIEYINQYKYKKVILFFDEADALLKENTKQSELLVHHDSASKVFWLNLEKITSNPRIYVFIATNKFDILPKPLIKRISPNRIQMLDPKGPLRLIIINFYLNLLEINLAEKDQVDLARKTKGMGMRDIELSIRSAKQRAFEENLNGVSKEYIETSIQIVKQNNHDLNKKELEEQKSKKLDEDLKVWQLANAKVGYYLQFLGAAASATTAINDGPKACKVVSASILKGVYVVYSRVKTFLPSKL